MLVLIILCQLKSGKNSQYSVDYIVSSLCLWKWITVNHCLTGSQEEYLRKRQKCKSGIFHIQILSFTITYFSSAEVQITWNLSSFLPKIQFQSLYLPPLWWHLIVKSLLNVRALKALLGFIGPDQPHLGLPYPGACPCTQGLYLISAWGVTFSFGRSCSSSCIQFRSLLSLSSCSFPATDFGFHLAFMIPGCLDLFSLILPRYLGSLEEVVEGSPWFLAHIPPSEASCLIAPQQPVRENNLFPLQYFLKKNVWRTCLITPHSIL